MSKILLIEGDRLIAANLTKKLRGKSHQVDWQVEAQAAIEAVDKFKPDLIILDLQLAGRSGIEFLYELRSYPDWQAMPVIVYSQLNFESDNGLPETLQNLGISGYIPKLHSTSNEILRAVDSCLAKVRS